MRLLMTMNLPYTRVHGGANRSNRCLAQELAALGHQVCVVVPALATPSSITYAQFIQNLGSEVEYTNIDGGVRFTLHGVEVHAVAEPSRLRHVLTQRIQVFQPDWTLVSSEDPSQNLLSAALAVHSGQVIYLAHTPQMLPFGPASLYPGQARTKLLAQTSAIVTISHYMADYVKKWAGFETFTNHPPHYGQKTFPNFGTFDHGFVLMMNASTIKGFTIFQALAREFPQVPFAALRGYATTQHELEAIAAQPNITLLPNQANMDDIFRDTRILLMPSLWIEGFGMATVDAMLRGIPVMASNCGGLVEAKLGIDYILRVRPIEQFEDRLDESLLPRPIVPIQEIGPWRTGLNRLLSDRAEYMRLSGTSRQAARNFVSTLSVKPFVKFLETLSTTSGVQTATSDLINRHQPYSITEPQSGKDSAVAKMPNLTNLSPQQRGMITRKLMERRQQKKQRMAADENQLQNRSPYSSMPLISVNTKENSVNLTLLKASQRSHTHYQPLFCIPGLGGAAYIFDDLAHQLDPHQTVYGLHCKALQQESSFFATSISSIARSAIETIRTVQPDGPYYLLGHSIGGHVAFEMARQLHKKSKASAYVILIDSYAFGCFKGVTQQLTDDNSAWLLFLVQQLEERFGHTLTISHDHFLMLNLNEQLQHLKALMTTANLLASETTINQFGNLIQSYRIYQNYRPPGKAPFSILLFRAKELPTFIDDSQLTHTLGWDRIVKGSIDVFAVPGNHFSMLTPLHVGEMAQRLHSYLQSSYLTNSTE